MACRGENARKEGEKDKPYKLAILEITEQILRVAGEKNCEIILYFTGEETETAYEQRKN